MAGEDEAFDLCDSACVNMYVISQTLNEYGFNSSEVLCCKGLLCFKPVCRHVILAPDFVAVSRSSQGDLGQNV